MKLLLITKSRLVQYFITNKLIFMTFFIGICICNLSFIYLYGNSISLLVSQAASYPNLRTYNVNFNVPLSSKIFDSSAFFNINDNIINQYEYIIIKSPLKSTDISIIKPDEWKDYTFSIASPVLMTQKIYSMSGDWFNKEEETEGKPVVVLPLFSGAMYDEVNILGSSFTVTGVSGNPFDFYIPLKTYINLDYGISTITVNFKQILSQQEESKFISSITGIFPESELSTPKEIRNAMQSNLGKELSKIVALYACSLLAFLFLMKYMIDQNIYENIIYSIVGCSKKKIIAIMLMDIALISSISCLVSIFVHKLLYSSLFEKINLYANTRYSNVDYLFILLISIVVSSLTAIPFIFNYARVSLNAFISKHKYM